MSQFKVEVCEISKVDKHPNADRLDIVQLDGKDWNIVTQKDSYIVGDRVVYFPIDSLLPEDLESKIFSPDSKIKLNNHRIRTIKIRGAVSQGMIVDPIFLGVGVKSVGTDVTQLLKVNKYEPKVEVSSAGMGKSTKKQNNPNFRKYTGIENAKNYSNVFKEGEEVIVTEKIHGSNWRAACLPFHADTLLKKLKKFLGLSPKYEFVYGSHNVQLQNKLLYRGFYESDIYAQMVKKYDIKAILKPGEAIYGEVYGSGVQKNYTYGCYENERKLVIFDVMVDNKYLNPLQAKKWCEERHLRFVPVLYIGPFDKDLILSLRDGDSILDPSQKVREGVVVKPLEESVCYIGRKVLKFISDNYLLKNQDDESLPH